MKNLSNQLHEHNTMNSNLTKVKYDKLGKVYWIKSMFYSIITLDLFVCLIKMFAYFWVNNIIGRQKAKIGKGSNVHPTCIFRQPELITIGENCSINHNNIFQAGKKTGRIILGNNVLTAANCMYVAYSHNWEDPETPIMYQDCYDGDIIIEDDVWLGHSVTVCAGVTIGKGSVIGAGSVVTRDIPPYSVAVGSPAKVVKSRLQK